ncbi:hypothetical protein ACIHCX_00250 [Streptomyces sp. NPDC052043]|uniref:hypothetical protein n=1 Tax=Streptomyces sp. NPDC052043 TaxID=3365684 RepID=UPI0037D4D064
MAAPAHLLLSALSKHVAESPADHLPPTDDLPSTTGLPSPAGLPPERRLPADPGLSVFSAEDTRADVPLTSEPPLPDAEPLTSEPPLAETAPLTSESVAESTEQDPRRAEL